MNSTAETEENYSLIGYVKQLIDEFATTINCPSNWRDIGSKLAENRPVELIEKQKLESVLTKAGA